MYGRNFHLTISKSPKYGHQFGEIKISLNWYLNELIIIFIFKILQCDLATCRHSKNLNNLEFCIPLTLNITAQFSISGHSHYTENNMQYIFSAFFWLQVMIDESSFYTTRVAASEQQKRCPHTCLRTETFSPT